MRKEGLYSSHLASWRKLYERGALKGENQRLRKKLWQAEKVIEVQKKLTVTLEALRREEEQG